MVMAGHPIKRVLFKSYLVGRITKWIIESLEFDITYEPQKDLKAHTLYDFVVETTFEVHDVPFLWTIFITDNSNVKGSEA